MIHAQRFTFTPSEITLKKGETVKIILISEDVPHGLTVDGLGIQATLSKGHPAELTVTPSQAGDFSGGCSVYCGSGYRDVEMLIRVVE